MQNKQISTGGLGYVVYNTETIIEKRYIAQFTTFCLKSFLCNIYVKEGKVHIGIVVTQIFSILEKIV